MNHPESADKKKKRLIPKATDGVMLKVESVLIFSNRLFERSSGLKVRMSEFVAFSL